MRSEANLVPVTIFTAAYLLVASFFAVTTANMEFIYYILVVVLLAAAAMVVHRRVEFSSGLLWLLSIWGLLHMIGGLMPLPAGWPYNGDTAVFYSLWIVPDYFKYDHLVHMYGFGTATWMCWQVMKRVSGKTFPTFGLLTFCVLASLGLGAFNEIVEFVAVLAIPNTNVGGYLNTGWDLVSNMTGAILAACMIRYWHKA